MSISSSQISLSENPVGAVMVVGGGIAGMQASLDLADQGYNVAKYLPFGPVKDVMPYLIRRAEENTSVAGQTNRELDLISTEKKRRKL